MPPIIEATGLAKCYRLGVIGHEADSFREFLIGLAKLPAALLRGRAAGDAKAAQPETLWALRDVSFAVERGEVVGVIGRNGAGKSTLLKVLSRITEPTEGEVVVRGRLASLLEVGTGFHPELTGRENVYLNGAILGMRRAEVQSKFDQIVSFAEVEPFLDTPVKRYSSGMYVRLAFAVAAHLDPEILVVDEVLSVGDLAFQKKCIGKMSEVSRDGRTVLFVSHNMAAVENLCRSAMVLDHGRITFEGAVGDALSHYVASVSTARDGAASHVVDLETAPRRSSRPPLLKRLELYTGDGEPLAGGLPVGGRLELGIGFELDRMPTSCDVEVQFETLFGQTVLVASTRFAGGGLAVERPGSQRLVLEIPSLTLMPGEYRLRLVLALGSSIADAIDDAVQISVIPADYYGSGKMPRKGAFVIEQSWRLES